MRFEISGVLGWTSGLRAADAARGAQSAPLPLRNLSSFSATRAPIHPFFDSLRFVFRSAHGSHTLQWRP